MRTSACLLVFVLLGYSQATDIEVVTNVPSGGAENLLVLGFEVKEVKKGTATFPSCDKTVTTDCYAKNETSKVNFVIKDKALEKIKFQKSNADCDELTITASSPPAGVTIGDANTVGTGVAVKCIPDHILPVKTGATLSAVPVGEKGKCPSTSNEACASLESASTNLNVKVTLDKDPVILDIIGTKGDNVKATYVPYKAGSRAAWLSHSSALIFASLAILFYLQ